MVRSADPKGLFVVVTPETARDRECDENHARSREAHGILSNRQPSSRKCEAVKGCRKFHSYVDTRDENSSLLMSDWNTESVPDLS
jgi:hypothetical protein